jgi:hypothetical protein
MTAQDRRRIEAGVECLRVVAPQRVCAGAPVLKLGNRNLLANSTLPLISNEF